MFRLGLYINDLSIHDSSRELLLAGTQQSAELQLLLDQVSLLSIYPKVHVIIPPRYTTASYYHVILPRHITTSYYHVILPCHTTTSYYHVILPRHTTTSYYHVIPPRHTTTSYYHVMLPRHITTSYYHVILPRHITMSYYHIILPRYIYYLVILPRYIYYLVILPHRHISVLYQHIIMSIISHHHVESFCCISLSYQHVLSSYHIMLCLYVMWSYFTIIILSLPLYLFCCAIYTVKLSLLVLLNFYHNFAFESIWRIKNTRVQLIFYNLWSTSLKAVLLLQSIMTPPAVSL